MMTALLEMRSFLNAQPAWSLQVIGWVASSSQTRTGMVDVDAICT
jgi:hypothetical protein